MSEEMTDDQLRLLFAKDRHRTETEQLIESMPATRGDIRNLTDVMLRIEKLLANQEKGSRLRGLSAA